MKFEPSDDVRLKVPHVLRTLDTHGKPHYLRLTHRFRSCVYAMWVTDVAGVRSARRPTRYGYDDLDRMEKDGGVWGKLPPPDELCIPVEPEDKPQIPGSKAKRGDSTKRPNKPHPSDGAWRIVAPLVENLKSERNLHRAMFSQLVSTRAREAGASGTTTLRLLKRYYYFGQVRSALVDMPPGPKPGLKSVENSEVAGESTAGTAASSAQGNESQVGARRPGRRSIIEAELGPNTFIVGPEDIREMVARLKILAKRKHTFVTTAHKDYLKQDFAQRHPSIFKAYCDGKHPIPVSIHQFRRYVNQNLAIDDAIAKNLQINLARQGHHGSLHASGPGEVYEIDATGGRIVLATSGSNRRLVRTPTIYLIIDRWSRFIVSVYVSLNAPAWDEVRYALLVAFTSRTKRFKALGIDIDDKRWPRGRMCIVLRRDRGSDLTSESTDQVVAGDLRIEPSSLPPITPNGKAIVERAIRTLKQWMGQEVDGAYAKRPLDLHSKRAAKKSRMRSVHSLSELYRELIRFIESYNNKPHTALRRISVLTQNGVPPTPQAAYLWGLQNITGLRVSTFSDEQLQRMLLSVDTASIANGQLVYKKRRYAADNASARALIARSTKKRKAIQVRVDRTFPYQVFVNVRGDSDWARFSMVQSDRNAMGTATLDEVDALEEVASAHWLKEEHEQTRRGIAAETKGDKPRPPVDRGTPERAALHEDQYRETGSVKRKLLGTEEKPVRAAGKRTSTVTGSGNVPEWKRRVDAQRQADLEAINDKSDKGPKR